MYTITVEGELFAIQRDGRTVIGPLKLYEARQVALVLNCPEWEIDRNAGALQSGGARRSQLLEHGKEVHRNPDPIQT